MKTILGVSAGAGVCLFPFKDKATIIGNIEARTDFKIGKVNHQFKLNFPDAISSDNIPILKASPDIIIGNPKCGSSSMLALSRGKQFTSHENEPSLDLFISSIFTFSPEMFFMENLPKLLDTYSKDDFRDMFFNYKLIFKEAYASEFGNSQTTRFRLIIIGVRRDIIEDFTFKIGNIQTFFLTFSRPGLEKINTCKHLDIYIPEDPLREDLYEEVTLYSGFKTTWAKVQQMWMKVYPKRHIETPDENFSTAPGVYINWKDDYPLVVRKSNRQFNYQGLPMTPRELCRIQGIPNNFKILDDTSKFSKKTLINKGRVVAGNTPPYEMILWFKEALETLHYL